MTRIRTLTVCTVLGAAIATSAAAQAAAALAATDNNDPFAFLRTTDSRPFATIIETDYNSNIDAGFSYVSSDSYTFGQYNGLNQQGVKAYLNMDVNGRKPGGWFSGLIDEWRFTGEDLGLDTRTMELSFGRALDYQLSLGFDQQQQVLNDTGRTPYTGSSNQTLPANWVASNITSGMTELFDASRQFDQTLQRDRFKLALDKRFGAWRISGEFTNEDKTGDQTYAGAIYVDGSNGHSVVLQRPVDYTTREFDLSAAFASTRASVDLSYLYSSFDNSDQQLKWQDPYDANFGPSVDYPEGAGQLALKPDNHMQQLRAVGAYTITPRLRLRFDSSYAWTEQDQKFLPFTVNDLPQAAVLPRTDLNGEVTTGTFNSSLYYRPQVLPKLTLEASYHFENRNNKSPRDGYLYVRGDAWAPDEDKFTVYNTPHERTVNRGDLEASYRLPWRSSKLILGYGYEQVERHNAAVSRTKENIFSAQLSFAPLTDVSARFNLGYQDRGASTYQWGQSFYALLDTELINEIPDNQRYITHPELSQYYVANRERFSSQASVTWTPTQQWNLLLDVSYINNKYDKTQLGLEEDSFTHLTLSTGYLFSDDLSANLFYSYDNYQANQRGRAFRGGIEKNAFDTVPPLAQASDPSRDWRAKPDDETNSVGASARWVSMADKLEMEWEYNFYIARGKTSFATYGAPDLINTPLPDNKSRQHQLRWTTSYHLRKALSLKFEYQYYRFKSDDWALDGVGFTSLDRVVWTGQTSPSDVVQYFMLSAQYRFNQ